ncbi:response regulator [Algoriphagus sp.]|uniref:response regulator n=1 Tax=Algoriphagus sp. TaxID=1872435 RepID=UPI002615A391|nr:response regulator [Algoriphagus sp.]
MKPQLVKILLIEDNEGDIVLTLDALDEAKLKNEVIVQRDGDAAINYLIKTAHQNPDLLPDLILLDINLPKKNGHEVLEIVKNNEAIKHIPIIILTTSSSEMDIFKAYSEHANCYIIKPIDVHDFILIVSKIEEFWFSIVKLPNN